MTGSLESRSSSESGGAPESVLVVGLSWVGDSVMAMPALQAYRRAHPDTNITLLVKNKLRRLWELHEAPDRIVSLESGWAGTRATVRELRACSCERAYILPHSFRSALVPWLARIPERIGMPGHQRDWMLTQVVRPELGPGRRHQAYEYLDLLAPGWGGAPPEAPALRVPDTAREEARSLLEGLPQPCFGLIPGAARGPSKQWPRAHYARLAGMLADAGGGGIALFGTPEEEELCEAVARGLDGRARNFAGKTTFLQWTALLQACRVVVANDSGGMHLAAALGRPVVALYGVTDPETTGPLGPYCRVLQKSDTRSRRIPRHSPEAEKALEAIAPEEVMESIRTLAPPLSENPEPPDE